MDDRSILDAARQVAGEQREAGQQPLWDVPTGCVYAIRARGQTYVKIGMTGADTPTARLAELERRHGAGKLVIEHYVVCGYWLPANELERRLHRLLAARRAPASWGHEWFQLSEDEVQRLFAALQEQTAVRIAYDTWQSTMRATSVANQGSADLARMQYAQAIGALFRAVGIGQVRGRGRPRRGG